MVITKCVGSYAGFLCISESLLALRISGSLFALRMCQRTLIDAKILDNIHY